MEKVIITKSKTNRVRLKKETSRCARLIKDSIYPIGAGKESMQGRARKTRYDKGLLVSVRPHLKAEQKTELASQKCAQGRARLGERLKKGISRTPPSRNGNHSHASVLGNTSSTLLGSTSARRGTASILRTTRSILIQPKRKRV
jgi:hypothetical protein